MGLFLSRSFDHGASFPRRFLCSIREPVSPSRPAVRSRRRAQELSRLAVASMLQQALSPARPHLDGFEHDGMLAAVGMTIRGEPASGHETNRAATLYSVGPRTPTMMQSCASAAKLRSGGPILPCGESQGTTSGTPPTRTVIGDPHALDRCWRVPSQSSVHYAERRIALW